MKKTTTVAIAIAFIALLLIVNLPKITNIAPNSQKSDSDFSIYSSDGVADPLALENYGSVFDSINGYDPWTQIGNTPYGYEFVSTAADNNYTYVLTSDGQVWRHLIAAWNTPTWSQLTVPLPYSSNGWKSIDVSKSHIYVLHADGDTYRILKDPGWPNPGAWSQSSNGIPIMNPTPLIGGETSFVSIAVDWNDTFCFVLRNNGQIFRHDCNNTPYVGGWESPLSSWIIYQSYGGSAPLTLEHDNSLGLYWGIPSTGWVSIDVFDNIYEPNYTVYALHNSGLVARHANIQWGIFVDWWLNPVVPWELDPRWNFDWPGSTWMSSTAFESIACNDLDIFIMKNTGEVFWVPEADFLMMMTTGPTWAWSTGMMTSPLPLPPETTTSSFVSIDAWLEPYILKNDGKEWRNVPYRTFAPMWDDCWDNNANNGQGSLYPNVFTYSSIAAYNQSTLFILSKNGSIYKSINTGVSWQKFGDLGYGNDSAWISIAAANSLNHSYIYILYNNGTVWRTTVDSFSPQNWGQCNKIYTDTSWVSLACDGNATVYTLRNLGLVSYRMQGDTWRSKGSVVGEKTFPDSSWVCIEAYHTTHNIYALRNDEVIDSSSPGSSTIWTNMSASGSLHTSFVALCQLPMYNLEMRNNGFVYRPGVVQVGTIAGLMGFVDICSYIDNYPYDNNPADRVVSNLGLQILGWNLYDDIGLSNYCIWKNGTPDNWGTLSAKHEAVGTSIANKVQGGVILNYTILYNDTAGQVSKDTVFVTVDWYPWSTSSGNTTTAYNDTTPTAVNWTLYDDWNPSHYRIWTNGTPSGWAPWTNGSTVWAPISRSTLGLLTYMVEFNDSRNQIKTNTIQITVTDPFSPWLQIPPTDGSLAYGGIGSVEFRPRDDYAGGFYRITSNQTGASTNWQSWNNATLHSISVDSSQMTTWFYTIEYNDSVGNAGSSLTVHRTITDSVNPWDNDPPNQNVPQNASATITWQLYDNVYPNGEGWYRVTSNATVSKPWTQWTYSAAIDIDVDSTTIGLWSYLIEYNDSVGNANSDEVLVTIYDNTIPSADDPADTIIEINTPANITWTLTDNYFGGYYRVLLNNTPHTNWTAWTSGVPFNVWINTSTAGIWNYTIHYNDSVGLWGNPETILITIDALAPWHSSPVDPTYKKGDAGGFTFALYDDVAGGYYRVLREGIEVQGWQNWTSGSPILIFVNTSAVGIWNYTVQYNDSIGLWGVPMQVSVVVESTDGGIPGFSILFSVVGLVALVLKYLQKQRESKILKI
jgi:hypothetical protein